MYHTIYGRYDDSVGQLIAGYFCKNTGYPITGTYLAMGVIKDQQLIGQIIFNDYTEANIEIHLYTPNCFTRRVIKDVYNYVFNQLGCVRLTAKPHKNNKKLLQLLERLGFVYEVTQENYYKENGELLDAIVYKLTKNTIPEWVKLNEVSKTAASAH